MRATALALLSLGCAGRGQPTEDAHVIDITALDQVNPAAAQDFNKIIAAKRALLSGCADPIRDSVRRGAPGSGRVAVLVRAVGEFGRPPAIQSVTPDAGYPEPFRACVAHALRGIAPTIASGDYALTVRVHLCIDPARRSGAS